MGRAPLSVGCGGVDEGESEVRSTGLAGVLEGGAAVVLEVEGGTLMKETSGASMGYCWPNMKESRYCCDGSAPAVDLQR